MPTWNTQSGAATLQMNASVGSQNQANNTSVVNWNLILYCYNGQSYHLDPTVPWSANNNGVVNSGGFGFDFRYTTSKVIAQGSITVTHNAAGNATISSTGWMGDTGTGAIGGNVGVGGTWDLPRIAKAPDAPTPVGISQVSATSFRYQFSGNNDGGASIIEWQAQISTNSAFTTGLQTQEHPTSGTFDFTGLANHTNYWARSRGRNAIGWGPYSSVLTTATLGHPTEPRSPVATPSTTVTGRVSLSWTAPATTGAGGIVGYNIYRNNVQIATTTGTGTSYTDSGLSPYTSYTYQIAARNAYSTSVSGVGPRSVNAAAIAPGPPSAPRNLTAVPDALIPGKVNLSWTAPINTGTGGITGYRIYFSGGALIANQNGTGTTYSVTDLNPGTTYSFQVFARNAIGDAQSTWSVGSNTATAAPVGEPGAPTGVTASRSTVVANRLSVSWTAPPGSLSGFSVFKRVGGVDTLLGKVNASHTQFTVDGIGNGAAVSFVVRARTVYTDTLNDGYPGNWGGPASAAVTATASNNSDQDVPNLSAASSGTNLAFNGTHVISGVGSNTFTFVKTFANIAKANSGGTITNNTNITFNGTVTVSSSPTPSTFTYAKTSPNITPLRVFGGTLSNTSNSTMNGTSMTVSAVNSGARTLTYTRSGANQSTTAVPTNAPPGGRGTVINLTNASFNVVGKILTAVTRNTLSYANTGANVSENNAAGIVTNITNKSVYNGIREVLSTPGSNILTVNVGANTEAGGVRTALPPLGTVSRNISRSSLDVQYRSGWIG